MPTMLESLVRSFAEAHPASAARALEGCDPSEAAAVLALVIGLAMIVNMVTAGLAGAAIPLLLQTLGRDPAQSSQIFLTTITDIVGFAALFAPLLT